MNHVIVVSKKNSISEIPVFISKLLCDYLQVLTGETVKEISMNVKLNQIDAAKENAKIYQAATNVFVKIKNVVPIVIWMIPVR